MKDEGGTFAYGEVERWLFDGIEDAFDDVGALSVLEGVLELSTGITLVLDLEDGDGVDVLVGDETDGALVGGVDGIRRGEVLSDTAVDGLELEVHVLHSRDVGRRNGEWCQGVVHRHAVAEALRCLGWQFLRHRIGFSMSAVAREHSCIERHLHDARCLVADSVDDGFVKSDRRGSLVEYGIREQCLRVVCQDGDSCRMDFAWDDVELDRFQCVVADKVLVLVHFLEDVPFKRIH